MAEYLRKRAKYIARCESCRFFDGNACTKGDVTAFDIVNDGERVFCVFWLPEEAE